MAIEIRCAMLLQCHVRRLIAKKRLRELRLQKARIDAVIFDKATKLAAMFRMRIARRRLRVVRRNHKLAIKIQKRVRIFLSKNKLTRRKLERKCAIKIQAAARGMIQRVKNFRAKEALLARKEASALVIQRNIRRKIGYIRSSKERAYILLERGPYIDEPVSNWLWSYGRDPDYGLKRTRRILLRALHLILHRRYSRIASRFGVVFVDTYATNFRYPMAPLCIDEIGENPAAFVKAYLPAFYPTSRTMYGHLESLSTRSHTLYLHIPSSLLPRETVDYYVIVIQCFARRVQARRIARLLRVLRYFLRRYKLRYLKRLECARKIVHLFKRNRALAAACEVISLLRLEHNSALTLQCALRCWRARAEFWRMRQVLNFRLINVSGFLYPYSPDYCLDGSTDTYWMVESSEYAALTVDMRKKSAVSEIGIISSMYSSSPKFLTVYAYTKEKTYALVVDRAPLALTKKPRWQKIFLPPTVTRYLKLVFEGNHGDPKHMSIRSIAVIKARERKHRQFLN